MRTKELLTYSELEGYTQLPENLLLAFWDSIMGRDGTEVEIPKMRLAGMVATWDWPFNGEMYKVYTCFLYHPSGESFGEKTEGVVVNDTNGIPVIKLHLARTPNGDEKTLFGYKWQGQTSLTPKQIMYWKLQKK